MAVGDLAGGGVGDGRCRRAAVAADAVEEVVDQAPADVVVRQLAGDKIQCNCPAPKS